MADIKEVIRCYSCGRILQSTDEKAPGYIKKEVLESEKQSFFFCEECFEKERHQKTANEPFVSQDLLKILNDAKKKEALFVYVINVFSFEAAFNSEVDEILKGSEMLILANKIDLLPRGTDLTKLKKYIAHQFLIHGLKIKRDNILLCSAIDSKIANEVLQEVYARSNGKDVYLIGAKLSGRRTVISEVLKIFPNKTGKAIVSKEYPGTTTKVMRIPLSKKNSFFDMPPIDDDNSLLHNLDRTSLRSVDVTKQLKPRRVKLTTRHDLLLGGLGLVQVINHKNVNIDVYMSPQIELLRVSKKNSDVRLIKLIEYKAIKPRLTRTKTITDFDVYEIDIDENGERDIGIQGLGWFTFKADAQSFRIFVPKGVSIYTSSSKVLKKD